MKFINTALIILFFIVGIGLISNHFYMNTDRIAQLENLSLNGVKVSANVSNNVIKDGKSTIKYSYEINGKNLRGHKDLDFLLESKTIDILVLEEDLMINSFDPQLEIKELNDKTRFGMFIGIVLAVLCIVSLLRMYVFKK